MPFSREPYLRVIKTTVPRCLASFDCTVRDVSLPHMPHLVYSTWELACKCGGKKGQVFGYKAARFIPYYDGTDFLDPLTFRCFDCVKKFSFIESAQHGYAAEFGGSPCLTRGTGEPDQFQCPHCSGTAFNLVCTFVYPDALFDSIQDDIEENAGLGYGDNVQDKFDQFWAEGTCIACKKESSVTIYELK